MTPIVIIRRRTTVNRPRAILEGRADRRAGRGAEGYLRRCDEPEALMSMLERERALGAIRADS